MSKQQGKRLTQARFEALRDMLVTIETEFDDHVEACLSDDLSGYPEAIAEMRNTIRDFLSGSRTARTGGRVFA